MEEEVQNSTIDVSIIIVNYNSIDLLPDCLASVKKNTNEISYEIIIVDNSPNSDKVEELLKNYDGIELICNQHNVGFGAANNQGIKIAKGKYILLLNNDTILFENSIKKVFDFAESLEGENIIGCKLLNEDKSIQKSVFDFPTLLNVFTSNFFLYLIFPKSKWFNKYHLMNNGLISATEVDVVTGAFLFTTRKSLEALKGFDERFFFYMEETDLCYRHKKNNGKVIYYPETSIIHLKGKSTKGKSWFKNQYQSISTVKFFQKYFRGMKFFFAIIFHYTGLILRVPVFLVGGILFLKFDLIKRSFFYLHLIFIYPSNQFKS